jgi:hypothetical protein
LPEAPVDGSSYGRNDAAWAPVVPLSGTTMTGALTLWADPTQPLQAATKRTVDAKVAKTGDTMTGALILPGDPTQPLQAATKQTVDARVLRTGDIMTGALTLPSDPTQPLQAATKQFVDAKVAKAGDTMTGALLLPGDPTQPLQAATKAYVDAHAPGNLPEAPIDAYSYGRVNASWQRVLPLVGGSLTGSLMLFADPTQPLEAATKQMVDGKVAKAGDTMGGPLTLQADPTQPLQAATKAYVDAHAPGNLPEAPVDSFLYGRLNTSWQRAIPVAGGTMTGPLLLAADPTQPLQAATKETVDAKVAKAGDTMLGLLTLAGDPTQPLQATTKQYTDLRVLRSGDTMTGPLALAADPTQPLQAATKQYVDAKSGGITDAPSDSTCYGRLNATWVHSLALAGGTMTGPIVLAADPTQPLQASTKQYSDLRVLKSGDTMTGQLLLQGNPTAALGAATKQYVDGRAGVIVSDTAPPLPVDGALWWESDSGNLYLRYNDGNSSQWVLAQPQYDASSFLLKTGDTMTGNLTVTSGAPWVVVNNTTTGAPGAGIASNYNGKARWNLYLMDGTAETGSNAGSNFMIQRLDDTGATVLGNPLIINRASGQATFAQTIIAGNGVVASGGDCDFPHGAYVGHAGRGGAAGGGFNHYWTGSAAQLWVDSTNIGNISVTSDYRFKENIEAALPALDQVLAWRPITYTGKKWNVFEAVERRRHSFLAHEMQDVSPDCVLGEKDGDQPQSLDVIPIIARLTKAIQELSAKVEALEARLT